MKKYFAIACIVFSASSVFFFAQAQQPLDPVAEARAQARAEMDAAVEKIVAKIRQKNLDELEKHKAELGAGYEIARQAAEIATQVSLAVTYRNMASFCRRVGDTVAACELGDDAEAKIQAIAQAEFQKALGNAKADIAKIKETAEAYVAKKIALDQTLSYKTTISLALQDIQRGQNMLAYGLFSAKVKLGATEGLVNSFLNVGNWGKAEWNAGAGAIPIGEKGLATLKAINDDLAKIRNELAAAEAGLKDGTFSQTDFDRAMGNVQALLVQIQNNASKIMSYVNSAQIARLAETNADAARLLAERRPQMEQAASQITAAVQTMNSADTRKKMEMMRDALKNGVRPDQSLISQLPQWKPPAPPTGGSNPVTMEPPVIVPSGVQPPKQYQVRIIMPTAPNSTVNSITVITVDEAGLRGYANDTVNYRRTSVGDLIPTYIYQYRGGSPQP